MPASAREPRSSRNCSRDQRRLPKCSAAGVGCFAPLFPEVVPVASPQCQAVRPRPALLRHTHPHVSAMPTSVHSTVADTATSAGTIAAGRCHGSCASPPARGAESAFVSIRQCATGQGVTQARNVCRGPPSSPELWRRVRWFLGGAPELMRLQDGGWPACCASTSLRRRKSTPSGNAATCRCAVCTGVSTRRHTVSTNCGHAVNETCGEFRFCADRKGGKAPLHPATAAAATLLWLRRHPCRCAANLHHCDAVPEALQLGGADTGDMTASSSRVCRGELPRGALQRECGLHFEPSCSGLRFRV